MTIIDEEHDWGLEEKPDWDKFKEQVKDAPVIAMNEESALLFVKSIVGMASRYPDMPVAVAISYVQDFMKKHGLIFSFEDANGN